MIAPLPSADVVMLGTFSAWNLGTIQARALPIARVLSGSGVRVAIVTTPWDRPAEAGLIDSLDGVLLINTASTSARYPLPAVREQVEWVQRLRPQVIHVLKPRGFGGFAGRMLLGKRRVLVDSDDWEGDGGWNDTGKYGWLQQRVFHHQELDLLRHADGVTAASTLLAARAGQLRGDEESVYLIVNGLEQGRIDELGAARTRKPSTIDPPVVLLYSRFEEFAPSWLPRFADELADRHPGPLTIRVVGRGRQPDDPSFEYPGLKVDLMGYVAPHRIPGLLASSALAVYPYEDSLITRSKQSVKLLELMASGCPVIASDVGDIARTLGRTDTLVSGSHPDEFASTAASLLTEPRRLDDMGASNIQRIRSEFDIASIAARLLDVYIEGERRA